MSDFLQAFAISASGMAVERLRLEVASMNIANANSISGIDGGLAYRPLRVVSHAGGPMSYTSVESRVEELSTPAMAGVGAVELRETARSPRLEHDPGNPAADKQGFVSTAAVNPVEEMVTLLTSVRAYEANVRAMNAAKTMALKALEIGGGRS